MNTGDAAERLRDEALRFAPDLVVYGASINDIGGHAYRDRFSLAPTAARTQSVL